MPKKGYTVITVKEDLYKRLAEAAKNEKRSIPNLIEIMFEEMYGKTNKKGIKPK